MPPRAVLITAVRGRRSTGMRQPGLGHARGGGLALWTNTASTFPRGGFSSGCRAWGLRARPPSRGISISGCEGSAPEFRLIGIMTMILHAIEDPNSTHPNPLSENLADRTMPAMSAGETNIFAAGTSAHQIRFGEGPTSGDGIITLSPRQRPGFAERRRSDSRRTSTRTSSLERSCSSPIGTDSSTW